MSARLPDGIAEPVPRLFAAPPVTIRPLRADDGVLLVDLVRGLSHGSRYRRFHAAVNDLSGPLLARLMRVDETAEAALLATVTEGGREIAVGEARFAQVEDRAAREFAVVVTDGWQRAGIGSCLLSGLMRRAAGAGVTRLFGDTFADNTPMLDLARKLGYRRLRHPTDARLVRLSHTFEVPAQRAVAAHAAVPA